MPISIDGNSLVLTGCNITIPNAFAPVTGVATIIITPAGGIANIPALLAGVAGQPALIDSITTPEYAAGAALPAPTAVQVSPGSAGVASHYALTIPIHAGSQGPAGVFAMLAATDLLASPPPTDKYMLSYSLSDLKMKFVPPKNGGVYTAVSIPATANTAASPRVLMGLSIPSQLFDWWPVVNAQVVVTGSADTRVDLVARVGPTIGTPSGNATTGDQVGYGWGVVGAAPPPVLINGCGYGNVLSGNYARVPAGSAATVYLVAQQVANSSNNWATGAAAFDVEVNPVP